MKTTRRGVFETNSYSTHVVAIYNGNNPVSKDEYFKSAVSKIEPVYKNLIIDSMVIPDSCVSFYDKLRALIGVAASEYWDRYYKEDDTWYMREQVLGEYPFSVYPDIRDAAIKVLAKNGIEMCDIDILPERIKPYNTTNGDEALNVVKVACWIRTDFLQEAKLDTQDRIEEFLADPNSYIVNLDGQSEYCGPLKEHEEYDKFYGNKKDDQT